VSSLVDLSRNSSLLLGTRLMRVNLVRLVIGLLGLGILVDLNRIGKVVLLVNNYLIIIHRLSMLINQNCISNFTRVSIQLTIAASLNGALNKLPNKVVLRSRCLDERSWIKNVTCCRGSVRFILPSGLWHIMRVFLLMRCHWPLVVASSALRLMLGESLLVEFYSNSSSVNTIVMPFVELRLFHRLRINNWTSFWDVTPILFEKHITRWAIFV